jgi:hypothetical protein
VGGAPADVGEDRPEDVVISRLAVWLREILGTLLVLGGMTVAGYCVWFLHQGFVIEGVAALFLTLIVLGLGTHLLKVALAVRAVHDGKR